ncbi:hypothetical protein LT330_001023 [Penicillium expansum]|uniref:Uncharacterized protein n=1 Tax=Penicillium expansum TaxID=27334 RepID=A0A0A2JE76_PENEN|nr:hypothetical protein PEX2_057340 [Penicillium expansum]KAK4867513.1 hypothetical protein LT330_001023 [Penicillium expansum]KGO40145.1 hypothetical protein PEXP_035290 [Penicillium expansum]KGO44682.1 hypothetical protein PEX1_017220 [Penicillium expansum]KGO53091.1 hypothetical protein PEX2_057340 [Penicillium expansum]
MSAELPEHYKDHRVLLELELAIDELAEHKSTKLTEDSAYRPSFFAPYPSIQAPSENIVDELQSTLAFEDTCFTEPVDRARQVAGPWSFYVPYGQHPPVDDYKPYKDLYQDDKPEFGTFRMTDVRGKALPHTKAFMYNDMDATDGIILRGELLTILRLMLGQLRKVFLVSFMGKRARAFESYFNGQALVLRTTKLYNFPEEISIGFKNRAEWYLSSPTGDTF